MKREQQGQSSDPDAPRSLKIDFYHLRDSDLATPLATLAQQTAASGLGFWFWARKTTLLKSVINCGRFVRTASLLMTAIWLRGMSMPVSGSTVMWGQTRSKPAILLLQTVLSRQIFSSLTVSLIFLTAPARQLWLLQETAGVGGQLTGTGKLPLFFSG